MHHDFVQSSRADGSPKEDLLRAIDLLARELRDAATATGSGQVPISARADYLRAQAAHSRAMTAWTVASGQQQQLGAVRDAVAECRRALEATRARLGR